MTWPAGAVRIWIGVIGLLCGVVSGSPLAGEGACAAGGSVLRLGFYAHFEPVSYSADPDPSSAGFDEHRGYEADLLTALEAMAGVNLSFDRRGIAAWDGIWQLPAGPEYDMVGGGITILDSRTRDVAGRRAIMFTAGHITFRQSLLVREADAERLARHQDLSGADRVGVLAGTTGEARLLELTGIVDEYGVLAAGTRVETAAGVVVADGSGDYYITAGGATPGLEGRRYLRAAAASMPQVVYLGSEAALIEALAQGWIDAVGRGEIGNRTAVSTYAGAFVVTALDVQTETGGFALAVRDAELAACIDRRVAWLTDDGRIGFPEWHQEPQVFARRAQEWPGVKKESRAEGVVLVNASRWGSE